MYVIIFIITKACTLFCIYNLKKILLYIVNLNICHQIMRKTVKIPQPFLKKYLRAE